VGRVGAAGVGVVTAVDGGFDGGDDVCGGEEPVGSSVGDGSPLEHPATATTTATTATPTLTPT
jgi:hypothetical protein